MISAVIPAFNEEKTVAVAVSELISHPEIDEVIVVDDGSRDDTAIRAAEVGARVIRLATNTGKAQAMAVGVEAARNEVILFMDADVQGFTHDKISIIIDPVISGTHEMFVGIRERSIVLFNALFHFFPILGGSRAITRSLWLTVPNDLKSRFMIEIALNYASKQTNLGMGFALIKGTKHAIKEKKYGLIEGFKQRLLMIRDIINISVRLYILRPLTSTLHSKSIAHHDGPSA